VARTSGQLLRRAQGLPGKAADVRARRPGRPWNEASVGLFPIFVGAGYAVKRSPNARRRVVRYRVAREVLTVASEHVRAVRRTSPATVDSRNGRSGLPHLPEGQLTGMPSRDHNEGDLALAALTSAVAGGGSTEPRNCTVAPSRRTLTICPSSRTGTRTRASVPRWLNSEARDGGRTSWTGC
jgi:hypothetical protein